MTNPWLIIVYVTNLLGTSNGYANDVGFSGTSSSAGQSQFSAATGDDANSGEILTTHNLKVYSFADLKNATQNFKSNSVLGIGGFGTVFKGWVDEKTLEPTKFGTGMIVAIKKLKSESVQGFREWQVMFYTFFSIPSVTAIYFFNT